MKRILVTIFLFGMLCFSSSAQSSSDTVVVDVTKLDQNELQLYQSLKTKMAKKELTQITPEKIEKYADIGRAFGSAFKECWGTVSNDAERFAQSPAGKMAMFLVAWKIMANDVQGLVKSTVRFFMGIVIWVVVTPFFILTIYRNCITKKRGNVLSVEKLGCFKKKVTYGPVQDPEHCDWLAAYGGCYALFLGILCLIMFA